MFCLRRIAVLMLLLTVPFQVAMGATGALCAHGGAMRMQTELHAGSRHPGAANAVAGGSHAAIGDVADAVAARHYSGGENGAGSCDLCGECSFAAAPIPASSPRIASAGTAVEVSWYVGPAALSRAGDNLFRPPRTADL